MKHPIRKFLGVARSRVVGIPLFRTQDWWMGKAIPFLAIASLSIAKYQDYVGMRLVILHLTLFLTIIFCIASFGFLLNDYCDRSQDRLAGRPSPASSTDGRLLVALMGVLFIVPFLLLSYLPGGKLASVIILIEYVLFLSYSVRPIRFKERGFAGPLADSLYGHVLPSVTAWIVVVGAQAYDQLDFLLPLILLIVWQLPLGLRHILSHQLENYEADSDAGERSFVVVNGRESAGSLVFKILAPIEALGLSLFLLSTLPYSWMAGLGFLVIGTNYIWLCGCSAAPSPCHIYAKPRQSMAWKVLSKYFHEWFSLLLILGIVIIDFSRWPLLLGYLILSPLASLTQLCFLLESALDFLVYVSKFFSLEAK